LVRRSISSIAEPFGNTRESRRSPSEKPTRSWPVRLSGTENRHKATYGSMTR